jgi:transposase
MSRLQLTAWQRQGLRKQLASTADARVYRRTLAVLEFDRWRPAGDIARMLGVTRQSVYNWAAAYDRARRAPALADGDREGRPRALDEDDHRFLRALLAEGPQEFGYPHASWTVPLLQEAVQFGTGLPLSGGTIRRALRRLGYVWKRPRYVLDPDPQRDKKTAHPAANPGVAAAQRRPGRGRDRPAALPAFAGRLVAAGPGRGRPA